MKTISAQVSIVLGTYNRLSFLKATIASVRASRIDVPYEIIVVDGGSTDGTIDWLTEQRDIIAIVQHNREVSEGKARRKRSWGYFMNLAFKCAEGRYVCLISDDSVVHPDTIANGVRHFDRGIADGHRLGAVAFYWRSWPEEKQYRVGFTLGGKIFVNHGLFLREALERVGWIDDKNYDFYCADGDLALRIWHAGYEIDACESALLEHFERADPSVRQQNLAGLGGDWDAYVSRWTGIYYDPAQPIAGGWTYLEGVSVRDAGHLFPREVNVQPPEPRPSLASTVKRIGKRSARLLIGTIRSRNQSTPSSQA
ncbi:MAG TPA: glycosyltransferase [Bradyrhizobium sp.]|nr:glycosyltransferase [Bradyrhizobium sp.]